MKFCQVIALIILCSTTTFSQSNEKVDSLLNILEKDQLTDSLKCIVLSRLAYFERDPAKTIEYTEKLLAFATETNQTDFYYNAHYFKAYAQKKLGNLSAALFTFFKAIEYAKSVRDRCEVYTSIADLYQEAGDYNNAFFNYNKAIKLLNELDDVTLEDSTTLAIAYLNAGDGYFEVKKLDSAMLYFANASAIFDAINHEMGKAYSIGNTGLVYAEKGDHFVAEKAIKESVEILSRYQDYYSISIFYTYMADIYAVKNDFRRAIEYAQESLEMAKEHRLKEQIRDANYKLYELYKMIGDSNEALKFHETYLIYKDSLTDIETVQQMADLRTEFEVGQKQAEVDLLTAEKRTQRIVTYAIGVFAFLLIVLAAIIYKYYRSKAKINRILADQKAELERLNNTKDKFFSIISHDLRSPVAGFNGISQMIKMMVQNKQSDQLLEMTEYIDESVDQLSKLLDNLLNWAMQQQGHIPNVPEKLGLKEMSDDLLKTLSNMAQGKSIQLQSDVPEDLKLWSDKNTTMTILRNLVNNALKFTPEGGDVGIRASEVNGMAKVEVYDTGVGMPKDKLKKLFQLQDKKSTYGTSGEKGLGLGLQLVHEFMEMNNGKIEVDSEEGRGTTFILWLPLYESVGTSVKA
ncbi:tetratricopeptide repeat-containing sensor histidine kinase [Ekhidna sp.]|uniref:tetratricopeptide repeat-containing sensor histidine kinase n=1 Tax=Ekhidna sp. TaxID=2608089 RepID=UPI003B50C603